MNSFHPYDFELLQQIFFPSEKENGEIVLFSTGGDVSKDLDLNEVAGVIDFGKTKTLSGFQSQRLHFINNPDGSIRWLVPTTCRQPVFLKLYNGSGWRGKLFRLFFKVTFFMKLKGVATSGSVNIFYRKKELFEGLFPRFNASEYAIFTGTIGENRKAVFALFDKRKKSWFFKFPLTASAKKLTVREAAALSELGILPFKKTEVPIVEKTASGLLVSDVCPAQPSNSFRLQPVHFESLVEVSKQTKLSLPLGSLAVWREVGENLKALENIKIVNDLPEAKIKKISNGLRQIYMSFDAESKITSSVSHGDFTPWNMYLSEERLHLYDWELSARHPLLFDAFHFIFQAGVLVERLSFEKIKERIENLKKEKSIHEILDGDLSSFDLFYRFYLLRNVSYYLARYIRQKPLHEQAHWLVDVWSDAVVTELQKLDEPLPVQTNEDLAHVV